MRSCITTVPKLLSASPLCKRERTEVRDSSLILISVNPHPTLSLWKGEPNIIGIL